MPERNSVTGHFRALSDPTVLKNIFLFFMLYENQCLFQKLKEKVIACKE